MFGRRSAGDPLESEEVDVEAVARLITFHAFSLGVKLAQLSLELRLFSLLLLLFCSVSVWTTD